MTTTHRSHDMTDKLREALAFYVDDANWRQNGPLDPNSANFTGGPARAALAAARPPMGCGYPCGYDCNGACFDVAAAPQPAPDREALARIIAEADDKYESWRGGTWAGGIADALLARGLRLPGGKETMAWAVVVDGEIVWVDVGSKHDVAEHVAEGEGGSVVRVAIRVVEGGDDAA